MSNENIGGGEKWDYVVSSRRGWLDFGLLETWRYRDLIFILVKRDFIAHKQSVLGPLWFLIQPIATTLVFVILFGTIAGLPTDGISPFLFYLSGLVIWNFFATGLTITSDIFISNAKIFGKVYFPRLTVPVSAIISTFLSTFAIQFMLFLVFATGLGYMKNPLAAVTSALLTIPLAFYTAVLSLSIGLCISALTTRFRDLAYMQSFAIQLWMYATPVIYPNSLLPQHWRNLSMVNPMAAPVITFRCLWIKTPPPDEKSWIVGIIITVALLLTGLALFTRAQRVATDTV